ncbi:TetR/AcrR family transcriptional regulator [Stenotrophomonas maltophilia]|uniref:TetR/AcrR family transcriptional regulator n=1 Tax=Stenotrophomonas maltophilia TaxID=40324 RepID=UPI002A97408E|nr:TetR/AcrR family transcriptional regulator [Stenotrophomonas maltophilia]
MGRSPTAVVSRGEATRQRLRVAAAKVFAERGFHETKVSQIVAELGMSQPTFYSSYPSKEAAYEELVGEFRKRLKALTANQLIENRIPDDQLEDRVASSILNFLEFLAEDPDLTEIGFFQPHGASLTKQALTGWIASNMRQEQATGQFRSDISAPDMAAFLVGMIDQMARTSKNQKDRRSRSIACARLFCGGVRSAASE